MSSFNTLEYVSDVMQTANERFSPFFKVNDSGMEGLVEACRIMDEIIEWFGATEFEFEVDDLSMDIIASITMPEMVLDELERTKEVKRLFKAAKSIEAVLASSDNQLTMVFKFSSIWDRVI